MSHLLVYAATDSRLHADVLIVRLKRAGIATGMISILHPAALLPDNSLCWIKDSVSFPLGTGDHAMVSGMLGLRLSAQERKWTRNPLVDGLRNLGMSVDQSLGIEESLMEDRIVVAVEVEDETELPAIYHTLRGLVIEKVSTAASAPAVLDSSSRSARYRRVYAAGELALAHFSAA